MANLVLLRHATSVWNEKNLFTGWVDIPLSERGIQEALEAGKALSSFPIDIIFVSYLIRAQMTAMLAMSNRLDTKTPHIFYEHSNKVKKWSQPYPGFPSEDILPVYVTQALNERRYGKLQGLNKETTVLKYGVNKVQQWRRSYEVKPPYGESLKMTAERVILYFEKEIFPYILKGSHVLICAHGNSLRALIMYLSKLNAEEIVHIEIPPGKPILYCYEEQKWSQK